MLSLWGVGILCSSYTPASTAQTAVTLGQQGSVTNSSNSAVWSFAVSNNLIGLGTTQATIKLVDVSVDPHTNQVLFHSNNGNEIHWQDSEDSKRSRLTLGTSQWMIASNAIQIDLAITNPAGKIRIYTDNTNPSLTDRYTGPFNPAGLYASDAPKSPPLPMAWRVVDEITATDINVQLQQVNIPMDLDGNGIAETTCEALSIGNNFFPYHYMLDQATDGIVGEDNPDTSNIEDNLCTVPVWNKGNEHCLSSYWRTKRVSVCSRNRSTRKRTIWTSHKSNHLSSNCCKLH